MLTRGLRPAWGAIALFAAVSGQPTGSAPPAPESELPTLGTPSPPVPYDPDPGHAWNRLHAALFRQRIATAVEPCLLRDGDRPRCQAVELTRLFEDSSPVLLWEGGDAPTSLLRGDVTAIVETDRLREVLAALEEALRVLPEGRGPEAAALLQHDLWERFDAVHAARRGGGDPELDEPLARLQEALAQSIRGLALTETAIRAIPSNVAEIAESYGELLPELDRRDAWVEVITHHRPPGADEESLVSVHAANAGYRSAFRTLVRPPRSAGGAKGLRRSFAEVPESVGLPPGTLVALLEFPLVVSRGGVPVALPLITSIETRRVLAPEAEPTRVGELTFEVLEGRRAWLSAGRRRAGGLERLDPDALRPDGGSCAKTSGRVLPLKGSCVRCHDPAGARIPGLARRGRTRLTTADPDPSHHVRATVEAKRREQSFAALRSVFETR